MSELSCFLVGMIVGAIVWEFVAIPAVLRLWKKNAKAKEQS